MKIKAHLTKEGLEKILSISSKMNRGRTHLPNNYLSTPIKLSSSIKPLINIDSKKFYSSSACSVRSATVNNTFSFAESESYKEWLGGLIDGDGYFYCTKKGLAGFKIIMDIKDKKVLYEIKHKYGGSIKSIAGSNSLKYKLCLPRNLIKFINDVNGFIRNPIRLIQLNKICYKYNIELKEPKPLTRNNGWFSGIMDSDGSIHIESGILFISITQNNRFLLDPLIQMYGGRIKILKSKDAFQYSICKKEEILKLLENYFSKYPLKSSKSEKLNMINDFYKLELHPKLLDFKLISSNTKKLNDWIVLKKK